MLLLLSFTGTVIYVTSSKGVFDILICIHCYTSQILYVAAGFMPFRICLISFSILSSTTPPSFSRYRTVYMKFNCVSLEKLVSYILYL